jgi:hypothetical protein
MVQYGTDNSKIIEQVYYDKTYDLQGDDTPKRISASEILWGGRFDMQEGGYYDWNPKGVPTPVKILKTNRRAVHLQVKNIGKPVHDVAAMIPHMGDNVENRAGWNFDKDGDQTVFPYIQHSEMRTVPDLH